MNSGKKSVVLNGLFKGMIYSQKYAAGSRFIPKTIGSYESEIQDIKDIIELVQGTKLIIDIGCAEGYYAVSLARSSPESKVYAYDVSPKARELTKNLAKTNGKMDILVKAVNQISTVKGKQLASRRCSKCGFDESTTSNTLFHKLKFGIDKAFKMLYEITTSKKGANSIW